MKAPCKTWIIRVIIGFLFQEVSFGKVLIWQNQPFYEDLPVLTDLQFKKHFSDHEYICLQNEKTRTTNQLWNSPDFGNLNYISPTAFILVQFWHCLISPFTGSQIIFHKWNCFTSIRKTESSGLIFFLKVEQNKVVFYMKV